TLSVTSGTSYYVVVDNYSTGIQGTFSLTITPPSPPPSFCSGAPTDCSDLYLSLVTPVQNAVTEGNTTTVVGSVQPGATSTVLDLMLVLDSSGSLSTTDPMDFRSQASVNLLSLIPEELNFRAGIVDFDS